MNVTKAIVLAGGYGTRRLPLTRAIEKCMLPVGNRPLVDYAVEDCIKAGITNIYISLSQLGDQIRAYYGRNLNFERYLYDRGREADLKLLRSLPNAQLHFFDGSHWPEEAQGTAMPIARFFKQYGLAADEQIVVVGGDDFIYKPAGGSAIRQLLDSIGKTDKTTGVLCIEVPRDKTNLYGVLKVDGSNFLEIVEKPSVKDAPSNLVNISKYVFDRELLKQVEWVADHTDPIKGEAYITGALNRYVKSGKGIHVCAAKGEYLDGGTLEGWLRANNRVVLGK